MDRIRHGITSGRRNGPIDYLRRALGLAIENRVKVIHPLISQSVNADTDSAYISWAEELSIRK